MNADWEHLESERDARMNCARCGRVLEGGFHSPADCEVAALKAKLAAVIAQADEPTQVRLLNGSLDAERARAANLQRDLAAAREAHLSWKAACHEAEKERDQYRDVAEGYRNVMVPDLRARAARLEEALREIMVCKTLAGAYMTARAALAPGGKGTP
jgi:hypothetical protein